MAGSALGRQSQEEIHDWMTINRKLRRHGLPSIRILPSQDINMQSDRYVCMDLESSQSLRLAVTSLMSEIDRKEQVVQNLEHTDSQLKDETVRLVEEVEALNTRMKDMKVMLQCSRARVQELEGEMARSLSQLPAKDDKLKKDKSAMASKCRHLEAKVREQDKELNRLHRELASFALENEHRDKRQNQISVSLKKPRAHTAMDDIIERNSIKQQQQQHKDTHKREPANDFNDILESYEKELQEKNKRIKSLEEQRHLIKQDLASRMELKDYRLLAQRVKKLEALLSQHNISIPGEKSRADPFASKRKLNTQLEDLESLPIDKCHQYLRELCAELETNDLECLTDLAKSLKEHGNNSNRFKEYCRQLSEIIENMNEQSQRHRTYGPSRDLSTLLCDSNMRYYLGVVENWSKDIFTLGELQKAINTLLEKVVPWIHARMEHDHSVTEMVELIERVTHADKNDKKATMMEDVSRSNLESIVSHFKTLFDVQRVSGIFPRMNEIYRVLGESRNVQNSLKNILGIPSGASPSALVDAVGKLCHRYNSSTAEQLKKLMQTDDLNSVIKRLHEHKEFFPAFKGVMDRLFDVLGVSKMEEVVPAVKALKLLAS